MNKINYNHVLTHTFFIIVISVVLIIFTTSTALATGAGDSGDSGGDSGDSSGGGYASDGSQGPGDQDGGTAGGASGGWGGGGSDSGASSGGGYASDGSQGPGDQDGGTAGGASGGWGGGEGDGGGYNAGSYGGVGSSEAAGGSSSGDDSSSGGDTDSRSSIDSRSDNAIAAGTRDTTTATGVRGFLGSLWGGITGFVQGIFSGTGSGSTSNTDDDRPGGGGGGGEGSGGTLSVDLQTVGLNHTLSGNASIFQGSIRTTGRYVQARNGYRQAAAAPQADFFPTSDTEDDSDDNETRIVNTLLIDHNCDETTNTEKTFTTLYRAQTNGVTNLRVTENGIPDGTHCFSIEIDTEDDIEETNENNNQSDWIEFTVGAIVVLPDIVTPDQCPAYQMPQCPAGEVAQNGALQANGCNAAPYCAPESTDTVSDLVTLADIVLETKVYAEGDATSAGPAVKILKYDWTDASTLEVDQSDTLHFRWNASDYSSCLIDLNAMTYNFSTPTTGNTESQSLAVRTLEDTYSVSCTKNGVRDTKQVQIQF